MKTINIFGLILTAGLLTACGGTKKEEAQKVRNVMVVTPQNRQEAVERNFSGVVMENSTISLSFRTPGQIIRLYVDDGAHVRKGQLLAELDPKDYQLQVDAAQTQYNQMQNEVARLRKLHESNSLSGNDFEKAETGLEQLRIQLQNAKNQLSYTRLTAPVDGTIQKVHFEEMEMVSAGMSIMDLVDTRRMEVEVNIPAEAYNQLGNTTEAYCISAGKRYELHRISALTKADANQLFLVKYALDGKLSAGMNVDVYLYIGGSSTLSGLSIPPHAIFENEGKACVWVVDNDNTVKMREVELSGVDSYGYAVVTNGLKASDKVVKAGVKALHEGDKVNIVTPQKSNVGDLL
ncbi:MAG: efflux RND transporter periplasmic adaptor subunit [Bacteroidaceae bacterium]|nr:efflux RND transporter periplasmic adaptor subunit [Bacteroidaceae bacterium]